MNEDETVKGDKLVLRGLKFHGFHGVIPEEKKLGQKFLVDVDAWLDLRAAGKSDCLSDTISYTEIYRNLWLRYSDGAEVTNRTVSTSDPHKVSSPKAIAKEVMEGPCHDLLESLAHFISITTLTKFSQISAVRVKIAKPHVAVQGSVD